MSGQGGLQVSGVITDKRLQEIPNKARGRPSRFESRFTLDVKEARDPQGRQISPEDIVHPTFGGSPDLLERFDIGNRVRIFCTTSSGRQIKTIEKA